MTRSLARHLPIGQGSAAPVGRQWPKAKVGELLTAVEGRATPVDGSREYALLGARWYAKGLYVKDRKPGSAIKASTLFRVEQGDFVYNRLFAWKGSFAVATAEQSGCYVSNEFPCFRVDKDRLDPQFLWLYFSQQRVWNQALGLSFGATPTSRNRLKEANLLAMTVPLPPLPEQRRIVAILDEIFAKLAQATTLRQDATEEAKRLATNMALRADLDDAERTRLGWRSVRLSDVIRLVKDAHRVDPARTYENLGIYSFGRGLFRKPPIDGALTSAPVLHQVRKGQFIYSRLFAFEGAYGTVTQEFDGYFVSQEYPTFECDTDRMRVEFLGAYFYSPRVWSEVAAGSKGLGDRRQRVQPPQVLNRLLWLPPLAWQNRIAEVVSHFTRLEREYVATTGHLQVAMPAILNRAFRGEL